MESGVVLQTLSPKILSENSRENTVVYLLQYQNKKVLLLGDAGEQTLFEVSNSTNALNADVLQINTRKEAINYSSIQMLNPKAIVVCGSGNFNYDSVALSSSVFFTSKVGRVSVKITNKNIIFDSFKK